MRVLVTGSAGFIGYHVTRRLLDEGHLVTGLDGMTPYYDQRLKQARLAQLTPSNAYHHLALMLEDPGTLQALQAEGPFDIILHLAAQAGVRYSLEVPRAYVDSNMVGTFTILELARLMPPAHLLLASTSSIYGANDKIPFEESDKADEPLTIYAATKKAAEMMAHSYAHLWHIPTTAFRFFTVYGPWGRPDMAPQKFMELILAGQPIEIYNDGDMLRDFTYIDDLVEAVMRLVPLAPAALPEHATAEDFARVGQSRQALFRTVNIGAGSPLPLMDFVVALETALGKAATKTFLPMQKGDVPRTFAKTDVLRALTGYTPNTPVADGLRHLVEWYRAYRV